MNEVEAAVDPLPQKQPVEEPLNPVSTSSVEPPPVYTSLQSNDISRRILTALTSTASTVSNWKIFAKIPDEERKVRLPPALRPYSKIIAKSVAVFASLFYALVFLFFVVSIIGAGDEKRSCFSYHDGVPLSPPGICIGSFFIARLAIALLCRYCLARRLVTFLLDAAISVTFICETVFAIINTVMYANGIVESMRQYIPWEPLGYVTQNYTYEVPFFCYFALAVAYANILCFWIAFVPAVIYSLASLRKNPIFESTGLARQLCAKVYTRFENEVCIIVDENNAAANHQTGEGARQTA